MRSNIRQKQASAVTHEGARGFKPSGIKRLRRMAMTCMLFEKTFYESGHSHVHEMADLIPKCDPQDVADLALEAKENMRLRHTPLFLARELCRHPNKDRIALDCLIYDVVKRPDELGEFVSLYWRDGKQTLCAAAKRGLAAAFTKFDTYQFGKWDRANAEVRLNDVMRLVHPRPITTEEHRNYAHIKNGTLPTPDTWEVGLSAAQGQDAKRAVFERLIEEGSLPAQATIMNLRNMMKYGVDDALINRAIDRIDGRSRMLPHQFVTAARMAPRFEPALESAMLRASSGSALFDGTTDIVVDVSYSMQDPLSSRSTTTRLDAACGVAIHLREACFDTVVHTFSNSLVEVAPRRGFALRDGITSSQDWSATYMARALSSLARSRGRKHRIVVLTDEQAATGRYDVMPQSEWKHAYIVNVGTYSVGVGDDRGWHKINGWSPRVLDYIAEYESCSAR